MNVWDDLNKNAAKTSRQWVSWAKQHAQEIGDAGLRHIERQDLLGERKQLIQRIGEEVANRFLVEEKKTLRSDAGEIEAHLQRIRVIDARLEELSARDASDRENGRENGTDNVAPK
ncbi:MAG: hypothetical protein ACLFR8_02145 [Alkalispirochaeta sp.]